MLTTRLSLAALLLVCCVARIAQPGDPNDTRDPFLTPSEPSGRALIPVDGNEEDLARTGVRTADSYDADESAETGLPYLFPEGRPPAPPELTYPDGTVPTQYPLDDDAYRGLPDAYPGASPGVPLSGPYISPLTPVAPPRAIGWKSAKASLTEVFGSSDTFGITSFDVRGTLEFGRLPGVFVTPQFGWHVLAGPTATDLPSQLYDFSADLSLYRPVGTAWLFNVALTPSLFTDGDNLSGDAIRILGRAMAYYTVSPALQWAAGIVYLDRTDVPVLPAFGAICQPRDDLRFELMFPKPRLAWRQYFSPAGEQWVYVTGELGGQSWGVVRASGTDDIATYRDLRFVVGVERKRTSGRSWFIEGGYVFGREIEYESNVGGASLSDTGFVRIGGAF